MGPHLPSGRKRWRCLQRWPAQGVWRIYLFRNRWQKGWTLLSSPVRRNTAVSVRLSKWASKQQWEGMGGQELGRPQFVELQQTNLESILVYPGNEKAWTFAPDSWLNGSATTMGFCRTDCTSQDYHEDFNMWDCVIERTVSMKSGNLVMRVTWFMRDSSHRSVCTLQLCIA